MPEIVDSPTTKCGGGDCVLFCCHFSKPTQMLRGCFEYAGLPQYNNAYAYNYH